MSTSVIGLTEIRNTAILKQTLTELGISYREVNAETLTWGEGYQKMMINTNTGEIKYDNMYNESVNHIKQNYSKNFIIAEIAKKGHRISSINNVNNTIEIIASY